jgi:hypothetical protein
MSFVRRMTITVIPVASFLSRTYKERLMDEIRNIQSSSDISSFLRAFSLKTSPFVHNSNGEKLFRRAEALVSALHLVTNHIGDQEPAKLHIRRIGLGLLSDILSLRDEMRILSPKARDIQASIVELIADVRILASAQLVSLQNSSELVEALDDLGSFLSSVRRSTHSESVRILKDDFVVSTSTFTSDQKSKGRIKDTHKGHTEKRVSDRNANARGESILKFLGESGEVGIKDIASRFPEYSEKMIQRELLSFVSLGKVKKTGSKRWSRYSLSGQVS